MKIKDIHIKNYKQFKDVKFDFTYPAGHPKQGLPLEKICFIGQSGTGKSNLLNLILQYSVVATGKQSKPINLSEETTIEANIIFKNKETTYEVAKLFYNNSTHYKSDIKNDSFGVSSESIIRLDKNIYRLFYSLYDTQHLYFFPAAADFAFAREFYETIYRAASDTSSKRETSFVDALSNQLVFCHQDTLFTITSILASLLDDYQLKEKEARIEATYKLEVDKKFDIVGYLNEWRVLNPNPLDRIVKSKFSDFIKELNVSVGFDSNEFAIHYSVNEVSDMLLSFQELSSGARQLLIMMMPLLVREPKDSIILVDEPETSLFPDIQRKLIDLFVSVGSGNQYFFATHSPIIASSFDPSERFFLYLDKQGSVSFERGVSPEGDDPNDLLINDFKLSTVLGTKGVEMYNKFLELKMKFEFEDNKKEKMDIANAFMQIAEEYGFGV